MSHTNLKMKVQGLGSHPVHTLFHFLSENSVGRVSSSKSVGHVSSLKTICRVSSAESIGHVS